MAIYNLYFESGSQAYVMHMSDDGSTKPIRILRENTDAKDELVRLLLDGMLISHDNINEDRHVHLSRIEVNTKTVKIYYEDGAYTVDYAEKLISPSLSVQKRQSIVSIYDSPDNGCLIGDYEMVLIYGSFMGVVKIVCSPTNLIYDVVLDFGSEASQMLISRRDSTSKIEPIKLFNGCARHFYGVKEDSLKNNDYDQQDEDPRLFRSIFYTKTQQGRIQGDILSHPSPNDQFISFISRREDEKKGRRIPNVKISYLADVHSDGLDMRELHRGMIIRFLYEALYQIADIEANNLCKTFAVRVTLLVPNVMSQNDVSSMLDFIQGSVVLPTFHEQLPTDLKLSMIEIRTCSESDASLLSWINSQEKIEPGRYLIIDVGKGTTDFSVVKVKDAKTAESIYRDGFVGAGNVLSYAILDNYITHMSSSLRRTRSALMSKLLKSEPARLYELEQAIEGIKRSEEKSTKDIPHIRIDDIGSIQVETILDKISSVGVLPDTFNIVSDMINKVVVREIAGRIKKLKFDHVVLSGRAFLYKPLFSEVCSDIQSLFPNVQIHYEKEEAKKGCLYGPLTPIHLSKYSNMVGIPQFVNISTVPNEPKDIEERLEYLKKKNVRNDKVEKTNILTSIVNSLSEKFKMLEGLFPDDDEEALSESARHYIFDNTNNIDPDREEDQIEEYDNNIIEIMSSGVPVKNYGANTRIYISGNSYIPSNDGQLDPNTQYSIYFDGKDFYLRSSETCWPLRKDKTLANQSPLLFESLFPYSLQLLDKNTSIPIPKALNE